MHSRLESFIYVISLIGILGFLNFLSKKPLLQWDIQVKEAEAQTSTADWPMAGANPQRTSWTSAEVTGSLKVDWYRVIEPFISHKVQVIAANNALYISTSKGLYAFDAASGNQLWVYPTAMPLGHSPTYYNGKVYVGGFDHRIHVLNASNGQKLWTFEAEKGFQTNPLVINLGGKTVVYAGNRDGNLYAIEDLGSSGRLIWKYQTGGPILFSAAFYNNTVYIASNDSYAYALNATTGALTWKSSKLKGYGFHSWWPVIFQNRIILSGSIGYREGLRPGPTSGFFDTNLERLDLYPNSATDPRGTPIGSLGTVAGNWVSGTTTIDASRITNYLTQKPWRQTVFVLDSSTGQAKELAPYAWTGTKSGNRYPFIVGGDNVLYSTNNYLSDSFIPGGNVSGWKLGTSTISRITGNWKAIDEPMAYAGGGKRIYYNLNGDRVGGVLDISTPLSASDRDERVYFCNQCSTNWLTTAAPGYRDMYFGMDGGWGAQGQGIDNWTDVFGTQNGIYGSHGDQNPPIPYQGRVYMIRSNALIAFSPTGTGRRLPNVTPSTTGSFIVAVSKTKLKSDLGAEIQKIITAGHLRPGFLSTGIFDKSSFSEIDYFSNPGFTFYVLSRVLPHLSSSLQTQLRTYLASELSNYSPATIKHIGWKNGNAREIFDLPKEVIDDIPNIGPTSGIDVFSFYGLWKYAQATGNAATLFNQVKGKLPAIPSDSELQTYPYRHNKFIAGYQGYLNLEKLATGSETASIRTQLNSLLSKRVSFFDKDQPWGGDAKTYDRDFNIARNFMYLTPELGVYLRTNASSKVTNALAEYERIAPYWFVSKYEGSVREGILSPLFNYHAIFQARSMILNQSYTDLANYIDVPGFERGDLFYIDNLVSALEASGTGPTAGPSPTRIPDVLVPGDANGDGKVDGLDYVIWLNNYGKTVSGGASVGDFNNDNKVDGLDYVIWLTNYDK